MIGERVDKYRKNPNLVNRCTIGFADMNACLSLVFEFRHAFCILDVDRVNKIKIGIKHDR